ncbi:hypothetical protein LCGC14_3156880 [marine sediment metagenome]|uniref:Uncharacterized protein n=1 Tax=marine sediment metagenome TaxID=412755 RepID=A0A0F8VSG1_9ZZZZ
MEATQDQILALLGEYVVRERLHENDLIIGAGQLKDLETQIETLKTKILEYEAEAKGYEDQGAD